MSRLLGGQVTGAANSGGFSRRSRSPVWRAQWASPAESRKLLRRCFGCLAVAALVYEILTKFIIIFRMYCVRKCFAIRNVNIWKYRHVVNYWSKTCEFHKVVYLHSYEEANKITNICFPFPQDAARQILLKFDVWQSYSKKWNWWRSWNMVQLPEG